MTLSNHAVTSGTLLAARQFPPTPKPGFPTLTERPTVLIRSLPSAVTTRLSVPRRRVVAL